MQPKLWLDIEVRNYRGMKGCLGRDKSILESK